MKRAAAAFILHLSTQRDGRVPAFVPPSGAFNGAEGSIINPHESTRPITAVATFYKSNA